MRRVVLLCLLLLVLPAVAFAHPEPGDVDGDGVLDGQDNCVEVQNGSQRNTDGDAQGDACDDDDDNDLEPDSTDQCPRHLGDECTKDNDGDGVTDSEDNCLDAANRDQFDNDRDGEGDVCDPDDENDGEFDSADNCPLVYNPLQEDQDGDGRGAYCDADDAEASSTGPGAGGLGTGASTDRTKPKVAVTVGSRHRLSALGSGLVVRLRCSEACAATVRLVADRRTARKLRLPSSRVAATDAAQVSAAATTYAFLRFPKAVKRRVWSRPVTRMTLRVEAVDRAGNKRTATRRLTLLR